MHLNYKFEYSNNFIDLFKKDIKKKLILKTEKYMLFFVLAKRMYLQLENWEDILRIIFDAIVWRNIFRVM